MDFCYIDKEIETYSDDEIEEAERLIQHKHSLMLKAQCTTENQQTSEDQNPELPLPAPELQIQDPEQVIKEELDNLSSPEALQHEYFSV